MGSPVPRSVSLGEFSLEGMTVVHMCLEPGAMQSLIIILLIDVIAEHTQAQVHPGMIKRFAFFLKQHLHVKWINMFKS